MLPTLLPYIQCNPGNTTAVGTTKNWSCNWMVALPGSNFFALFCAKKVAEVESSRTHFEVLGLGLEASSPQKLACPRLEDNTIFWFVKILWSAWKIFWKTFFCGDRPKNFCEDLFFFWEQSCACVLVTWPWPRAFLSLASKVSVLEKAVLGFGLGLGLFLRPWPWPRALCPRLHLW